MTKHRDQRQKVAKMGWRTLVAKAMGHPSDEPGRVSRHRRRNTKKNLSRARRILDHEMEVSHDEE